MQTLHTDVTNVKVYRYGCVQVEYCLRLHTFPTIFRGGVKNALQIVVSGTHNYGAWGTFHCLTSFYDTLQ